MGEERDKKRKGGRVAKLEGNLSLVGPASTLKLSRRLWSEEREKAPGGEE